ncbi:MAG: extracellular solute-binding protein [Candidatus Saelkia tenebricola]|nr:extracellular solute-binding protein [Candidatus Saelkia tenebricola]
MKKISILIVVGILLVFIFLPDREHDVVVVYVCLDQIFSEPILKEFERDTGIKVKAVYDIEATKTTGLTNRIIAEQDNPRCDVFWNNEIARTILLKNRGILEPYVSLNSKTIPEEFKDSLGYWTGFAARARVIIYNTDLVNTEEVPSSLFDLTDDKWRGKCAIANPLFGTASTHFTALFAYFGEQRALDVLERIRDNDVVIAFGNSVVKDQVASGELYWGFTDTDDVNVAIENGRPVAMILPDQDSFGTLLIPNTVACIKGAPNPQNAKKLVDYLLSLDVEEKLAHSKSIQISLHQGAKQPENALVFSKIVVMPVDYVEVAELIRKYAPMLQKTFLK